MIKITPTGRRLLVKVELEKESKSGLTLVHQKEEWQAETLTGQVVAIGPDVADKTIKVGSFVFLPGHAGRWVDPELTSDQSVTHRIVEEEDLFAILEETPEEVTV